MIPSKIITPKDIVFGSMRMLEYDYSLAYWVDLFSKLHDAGVTKFHSSIEYESFSFYCDVLTVFYQEYPEKKIKHIVKLAEPSFHEHQFNQEQLFNKVEEYLLKLNTEKLYGVQWMWRGNLENHQERLLNFTSQYSNIKESIIALKENHKIDNFFCFPYDANFANSVIQQEQIDGLIVYRNVFETEYDDTIDLSASLNKKNYILRPLFGGKAVSHDNKSPKELVQWALDFSKIEGAIISISSIAKFEEII